MWCLKNKTLALLLGLSLWIGASSGVGAADFMTPIVRFHTLKNTVAELLPDAVSRTKRSYRLPRHKLKKLQALSNWDSPDDAFVFFHARDKNKKITRTLVVFPEYIRQGVLLMAVALDHRGRILEVRLMEGPNEVVPWVQPLLRHGYLDSLKGKDHKLKLVLGEAGENSAYSKLTRDFALRMTNAAKKSAQLFTVAFRMK